jgi:hypothetical protein
MGKHISDCERAKTSTRIKDILRALIISNWQSDTWQENQNFAENHYGTIKGATSWVFNQSGAPADCWLLALKHICHVLKLLASATLGWIPTLQALTCQTQDTSTLLARVFYEPVYYNPYYGFPSNSNKVLRRWVGVATNVEDILAFKLLAPCN